MLFTHTLRRAAVAPERCPRDCQVAPALHTESAHERGNTTTNWGGGGGGRHLVLSPWLGMWMHTHQAQRDGERAEADTAALRAIHRYALLPCQLDMCVVCFLPADALTETTGPCILHTLMIAEDIFGIVARDSIPRFYMGELRCWAPAFFFCCCSH